MNFSPDGRKIASGSWDHSVKLFDVGDRKLIQSFDGIHDSKSLSLDPLMMAFFRLCPFGLLQPVCSPNLRNYLN